MVEPRAERPHMPDYGVGTESWSPLPWSWAAAEFLGQNLLVEFEPDRAFAVIEREDEFSTRATRWVFAI